jgi:hypothetical protein
MTGTVIVVVAGIDWNEAVAILTGSLAAATFSLAWTTRRMARSTAEDVAAQNRPILVPGPAGEALNLEWTIGRLTIAIKNAGRGVALDVQATAETAAEEHITPSVWDKASIAPGDLATCWFPLELRDDGGTVTLRYRDIAGRQHISVITIDFHINLEKGEVVPRFFDTIVDPKTPGEQVIDNPDPGDHPASHAVVTEWVHGKLYERKRRSLLD